MPVIPSTDELEKEFGRYLDNPGILAVSAWTQPNTDKPFDEEAHLEP